MCIGHSVRCFNPLRSFLHISCYFTIPWVKYFGVFSWTVFTVHRVYTRGNRLELHNMGINARWINNTLWLICCDSQNIGYMRLIGICKCPCPSIPKGSFAPAYHKVRNEISYSKEDIIVNSYRRNYWDLYLESPDTTVKSSSIMSDQTVVSRCFSVRPVDIRVNGWPVTASHTLMVSGEPEIKVIYS